MPVGDAGPSMSGESSEEFYRFWHPRESASKDYPVNEVGPTPALGIVSYAEKSFFKNGSVAVVLTKEDDHALVELMFYQDGWKRLEKIDMTELITLKKLSGD